MKYSQYVLIIIVLLASASMHDQAREFESIEAQETKALLDVYSERLKTILNETIKVTEILEELIILHNGNAPLDEVERLTRILFDENIHINISYAPDGVIKYTYPLEGNEEAIGHDLLEDPNTRTDAQRAKETGNSTLSKPYLLRQGRVAAVVRDPVYIQNNGDTIFWGFIAIAMQTSKGLIMHSDIDSLEQFHYEYHLCYLYKDEKVEVIRSTNYKDSEESITNSFNTRYGTWKLSMYHETTLAESLRRILAFWMFYITLICTIIYSVYIIRQKILKKKRR